MSERGKASVSNVSLGSNTTVKSSPGTLYRVLVSPANGATVWLEGAADLGASPNLNAAPGAATIAKISEYASAVPDTIDFGPGVGFDALTVAASSNARLGIVYE